MFPMGLARAALRARPQIQRSGFRAWVREMFSIGLTRTTLRAQLHIQRSGFIVYLHALFLLWGGRGPRYGRSHNYIDPGFIF